MSREVRQANTDPDQQKLKFPMPLSITSEYANIVDKIVDVITL